MCIYIYICIRAESEMFTYFPLKLAMIPLLRAKHQPVQLPNRTQIQVIFGTGTPSKDETIHRLAKNHLDLFTVKQ